ncbi:hypothetical protein GQ600_13606 [Phytophthora cactorum]|nr:hypothetical protein GQ600_13606 [Phytophthora cactorum]
MTSKRLMRRSRDYKDCLQSEIQERTSASSSISLQTAVKARSAVTDYFSSHKNSDSTMYTRGAYGRRVWRKARIRKSC